TKDEIKERVLDRFWRPATPAVREWLEVELNDKTKPRVTKRTVEKPDQSFAESMLAKPGKGIAFLQKDKFDRLKKDFTELCE
ncbi:MAG: hypothetical protein ACXWQE_13075, partial [Bdellovibrionales bacterium]